MLWRGYRISADDQASVDEGLRDPLLVGLLIVEGDVDPVVRQNPETDALVDASEDRTYPLRCASGAAARDVKLICLFRRGKRRGQD